MDWWYFSRARSGTIKIKRKNSDERVHSKKKQNHFTEKITSVFGEARVIRTRRFRPEWEVPDIREGVCVSDNDRLKSAVMRELERFSDGPREIEGDDTREKCPNE